MNCGGVCKARDDEEETGVFRLIRAVGVFFVAAAPQLLMTLQTHVKSQEPKMKHRKIWTEENETPKSVRRHRQIEEGNSISAQENMDRQ